MNQKIEISGAEARAIVAHFFNASIADVLHCKKDAEGRQVFLPREEFDRSCFVITKEGTNVFAERYDAEDDE